MEAKHNDELTYDEVALLYRSYEKAFADVISANHKTNALFKTIGDRLSVNELQTILEANAMVIETIKMLQAVRTEVAENLKKRGAIDKP